MNKQQQIVEILKNHSNPWGYQLCGEDSFEEVAEEVMGLFEDRTDWIDYETDGLAEEEVCDNPHCDEGVVDRDYYGKPIFCHCCEQGDR